VGANGRLWLVCAAAVLLIALVGVARVFAMSAPQRVLAEEIEAVLDEFDAHKADMMTALLAGGTPDPASFEVDDTTLRAAQRDVSESAVTWAFLAGTAVLIGCAIVAYQAQSLWQPVLIGMWGWLVSGLALAWVLRYAATLYVGLSRDESSMLPPGLLAGRLPFAIILLAGLSTTFFWQSALPCAVGTYVGLRARVWRMSTDFVGTYHDVVLEREGEPVQAAELCACGARNLPGVAGCYACGGAMEGRDE